MELVTTVSMTASTSSKMTAAVHVDHPLDLILGQPLTLVEPQSSIIIEHSSHVFAHSFWICFPFVCPNALIVNALQPGSSVISDRIGWKLSLKCMSKFQSLILQST